MDGYCHVQGSKLDASFHITVPQNMNFLSSSTGRDSAGTHGLSLPAVGMQPKEIEGLDSICAAEKAQGGFYSEFCYWLDDSFSQHISSSSCQSAS